MSFFEKIKEVIYTYKVNLIITGGLLLLILIGNISIYYILANKINTKEESIVSYNVPNIEENKILPKVKEEVNYKVDIKGAVLKEGVYELNEKSRVIDVINLAGGLKENADTSVTNLSKYITDEMVIVIYTKEEVEKFKEVKKEEEKKEEQCIIYNEVIVNDSCKEESNTKKEELDNKHEDEIDVKISINNADIDLLMTLPGIGESKAKSIIEYREQNPFTSIEDIMNVSGIGEKAFEQIKNYITL